MSPNPPPLGLTDQVPLPIFAADWRAVSRTVFLCLDRAVRAGRRGPRRQILANHRASLPRYESTLRCWGGCQKAFGATVWPPRHIQQSDPVQFGTGFLAFGGNAEFCCVPRK